MNRKHINKINNFNILLKNFRIGFRFNNFGKWKASEFSDIFII